MPVLSGATTPAQAAADRIQAMMAIGVCSTAVAAFAYLDWVRPDQTSTDLAVLLTTRAFVLLAAVVALNWLRGARTQRAVETATFGFLFAMTLLVIAVAYVTGGELGFERMRDFLTLICIYAIMPLGLPRQFAVGAFFSVGMALVALQNGGQGPWALAATHVPGHAIGAALSWIILREKRRHFLMRSYHELYGAGSSDAKLVAICVHCHDVRGEDQRWVSVPEYFSNRFEVGFSHGICPRCFARHYPELGDRR